MKINVNKFQAGGYVTYRPLPVIPESQPLQGVAGLQQSEAPPQQGIDDKTMDKLLGKGLTNDVMVYSDAVNQAYIRYANMSEAERNSNTGRSMRNMLKGDPGQLNALIQAKGRFDKSLDLLKANDAQDEFAVTSTGAMVVKDQESGDVTTMSFKEYASKKNSPDFKYKALTNSELATEREYNEKLVGNTNVFGILDYGIGMRKIKEEVWKIKDVIKANSESKTLGDNSAISQGMDELEADAKAGAFKIKQGHSETTNSEQVAKAKQTMWVNLSENSKNVLRARAAMIAEDPSKVEQIAMTMATSLLDPYEFHDTKDVYDESAAGGKSKGAGGGGTPGKKGYYEMLAGTSGAPTTVELNMGTANSMFAKGQVRGAFPDGTKPYGTVMLSQITQLANVADMNNVSMGGVALDRTDMDAIVYDNGRVVNVNLPYKKDEKTGKIVPDLQIQEVLAKAEKEIPKNATVPMKENAYRKYGIPTDGRGEPAIETKQFIAFDAYINDAVNSDIEDSPFLTRASVGDKKEQVQDLYKKIYKVDSKGKSLDRKGYHWYTGDPDVYRGTVFIPATQDVMSGRYTDGNQVEVPREMDSYQAMYDYSQNLNKTAAPGAFPVEAMQPQQSGLSLGTLKNMNVKK